jgi:hypothetical protein
MFVQPSFPMWEDLADPVMLRVQYPKMSYSGHCCRGSRQLIGHENGYDEILRMFSVSGMSVTAEPNCGAGSTTTELRFEGRTYYCEASEIPEAIN